LIAGKWNQQVEHTAEAIHTLYSCAEGKGLSLYEPAHSDCGGGLVVLQGMVFSGPKEVSIIN